MTDACVPSIGTGRLKAAMGFQTLPYIVYYAGLSTYDVKRAVGVVPNTSNTYGMDFSGTTNSGERVMGLIQSGAASSVVRARPELLWPVPAHWSLEDAATVPLAYAHAFYCLIIKGKMKPGMKVLVVGGAGALGQAAIAIALAHQCEVYTTVSEVRKKVFLRKLYPQLKDEHIASSHDGSIKDLVLSATKKKGCNVVITCMRGGLKDSSIQCTALNGIVVDTVQLHDNNCYELGMANLILARSYVLSDFSSIFTQQNYKEMTYLQTLLSEGIRHGYVRPLMRVTYASYDSTRALHLLEASRHCGRVLLRIYDQVPPASPRIICNPDEWQLLFWDDGFLGVQLADRLIQRGARKLYIHSTSITPYQQYKIKSWRKFGTEIAFASADLIINKNVQTIINCVKRLGDVEGIYVVITKICDDKNKEDEQFIDSLDLSSRSLCPRLKHFAVVSTVSAVGQNICQSRAQCGYTATSLDLSRLNQVQQTYSHRDVLEAAERSLRSTAPVLIAQPGHARTSGLLQELTTLAGINVAENKVKYTELTLQELEISDEIIRSIGVFLNVAYNISLTDDTLRLLTLERICELAQNSVPAIGLEVFFTKVEVDELLATSDLVPIQTLNKDITLTKGEFDVNRTYLCIVPGMEGNHLRFHVLCERLKLPAFVLQPGFDQPRETVRETAKRYAQTLLNKTRIQNNFYLLGYETGVLEVLEITAILEDHGLTGTVFLAGCSPDELKTSLEEELRGFETEEQLQMAVLRHMMKLLGGDTVTADLNDKLLDTATWSQKVSTCLRVLRGRVPYSAQYARALIEAALARIQRARGYVPTARPLRSQLVLLRAADVQGSSSAPIALQRHSLRPVAVHQLRTSLAYVANDMECPAIINRYLDNHILSEFAKKNLCEAYHIRKFK